MKTIIKKLKVAYYWLYYHSCSGLRRQYYKQKSKRMVFLDSISIDTPYTDVYILTYHSGEIFTFLELLRSSKTYSVRLKNSLLVATRKYHIDLIEMVCPEMKYIFIPKLEEMIHEQEDFIIHEGKKVHIIFLKKFDTMYRAVLGNSKSKTCYAQMLLDAVKLDVDLLNKPQMCFDKKTCETVLEKKSQFLLNTPFVFIAPEALTLTNLPYSFWKSVSDKLSQKGYDCFFNLSAQNPRFKNVHTFQLSVKGANILARQAAAIITVRSGLAEQLAVIENIPKVILYTDRSPYDAFSSVPAARCLEFYTLKKYPFVANNIYEFNAQNADEKLVDQIIQIVTKDRS